MTINPKLLEPTLLWENQTPTTSFASTTITLNEQATKYKYIIIKVLLLNSVAYMPTIFKFDSAINQSMVLGISSGSNLRGRECSLVSNGYEMYFTNGETNSNSDNTACIPVAIYGTNIL